MSHFFIFVGVKIYTKVFKSFVVQILKLDKVLVSLFLFNSQNKNA